VRGGAGDWGECRGLAKGKSCCKYESFATRLVDMSSAATYAQDMSQESNLNNTSKEEWLPDVPYQSLPLLPPSSELETPEVLRACIRARSALAELKQAGRLVPNPDVLLASLPLLEAQASSEIENIVTTADSLFRHLEGAKSNDPATREALRYREALLEGYRALDRRPLGLGVAERICTRIKAIEMSPRRVPGTFIGNARTGEVIYTPPAGEAALRDLLSNWEQYLHGQDETDPLVRMAVAHYQFEAIHPFNDGNGRTGRILNSLYLVERGLLPSPLLYLSRHIINSKADYYRLLLNVTSQGAWGPWLLFMLEGVAETSIWTLAKVEAIRNLVEATREHVRTSLPKIYSAELVELLFIRPYCRISNLVDAGLAGRQATSRHLQALVQAGVLEEQQHGREKLFVNTRLLHILTTESNEFADFA
jgi:Fic family protein